jgi:hypothetical protein
MVSLCAATLAGQTTQGLISGRLVNSVTGRPVANATVSYTGSAASGTSVSDARGYYYILSVSPGTYLVRAAAPGFQAQEVQELELRVASRIELDFRLRPLNDVWESGQYNSVFLPGSKTIVTFFGPDVDPSRSGSFESQQGREGTLESTVSEVIDSPEINNLPLAGRDVYTMLVTLPGVTSDAATARGLGLSINGQRPSSSNYLLDGMENNNYLTTGPLTTAAPEAVQEYRVSTNNFSAEYGRTSGFVANAITRSGSEGFHGVGYFYLMNDVLNGNGFQENLNGFARAPDKQIQPGLVVGGPVLKNRLYFSSSYEYFRSRSFDDPVPFTFPATPGIFGFALPGTLAQQLLQAFPPPAVVGNGIFGTVTMSPPVEIDRTLGIQRFDYSPASHKDKWMARLMGAFIAEPDFIWTPYTAFTSALHENTGALGITGTHTFRPNLTNEVRGSYSVDDLHWNRPHSEIPTLVSSDGVSLPGSPAFYAYRNVNATGEFLDNVTWAHDKHLVKAGAGVLLRGSDGYLTAGQAGEYVFTNVVYFALGMPQYVSAALSRAALPQLQTPDYNRSYRYQQYYGFVQDTYKITSRLTANYGLRYDLYGAPSNTGQAKDSLVQLGPGSTLAQQLTGASLVTGGSGNQKLFGSDEHDWGVRLGAAYDLSGNARTLLRGGFGTYYDRPFDNLWENLRNNGISVPLLSLPFAPTNFLAPLNTVLASVQGQSFNGTFPELTLIDPHLRNGLVKSYFAGIQQRFTNRLTLDVNALGTYGTHLITTDIVNRSFSTSSTSNGRYNPSLPDIAYRSGQGFSNYNALAAVLSYRGAGGMLQATYTWSHTIDNQSDPLLGDFFNLSFANVQTESTATGGRAAFSEQFNPNVDRGNADFDQRQNLVLLGHWDLPGPFADKKAGMITRDWSASVLAAFRSGLPYTVFGSSTESTGQGIVLNDRANILNPGQALLRQPQAVPGGQLLLNIADFANAPASTLGNSGRNAFTGPGFYSVDLSVARSFALPWLGDKGRITFRASAFNVLNHANLNNPGTQLNDPNFGVALYGRQGTPSGFPAISPLNETPRQIQLSVRLAF